MSLEAKALRRAEQFVEWMQISDGRFPTTKSQDPIEHKLGVWIVQMRCAKRERPASHNNNMRLYESVERYLTENVPNWLDGAGRRLGDREAHCKEMALQIVAFYEKHGRLPVTTPGTPDDEQLLGRFLQRLRLAKRGRPSSQKKNNDGRPPWCLHPSVEKIMDEGVPMWWMRRKRSSCIEEDI
jgi:hypothetical protein